jgi:D-cysteine desulfhydrase
VAGLALGTETPITAVSVSPGSSAKIERVAGLAAKEVNVDRPNLDHVSIDESVLGEGYGVPTDEVWSALRLFARTEGIVLDPVYTGKAAAALVAGVRPGETVLFMHTGGVPANFAYAPELVVEAARP